MKIHALENSGNFFSWWDQVIFFFTGWLVGLKMQKVENRRYSAILHSFNFLKAIIAKDSIGRALALINTFTDIIIAANLAAGGRGPTHTTRSPTHFSKLRVKQTTHSPFKRL